MKVLALDTSTEYCSVALWRDGAVIERCKLVGQSHSEVLIAMVDALLKDSGFGIRDIDGIAFGMGPGSFTGVRIACGATQGLALGANLPVAGVCTLQALAEASGKPRVIAALDARMSELYLAAYEKRAGVWITVVEPCLCKPEDAPMLSGEGWFGAGSGFSAHGAALGERYAGRLQGVDGGAVPQAAAIAVLGAARFALGHGVDAAAALPLYLRDKVALKTNERVGARETLVRAPARRAVPVRMRDMMQSDVDAVLGIERAVQAYPWTRGNFIEALNSGYVCRVAEELLMKPLAIPLGCQNTTAKRLVMAGHPDEVGGEIRGYAILMPAVDEAEMLVIGVSAAQQRKGLGRMMLNEMLETARKRNFKRVFLEVRSSNVAAIALYRCAGFTEIGVRRGYYQNANGSEDALVMACDLKGETDGQA